MDRIYFSDKNILTEFFKEIKDNGQLKSWRKLASYIGTARSNLGNYRNGNLLLSEERFLKLLDLINEEKRPYFLNNLMRKNKNWGQIIGGKKAYKINKKAFDIGRNIAYKNRSVKYDFDINMPLSNELCEFIGAIIGDGFTNKYKNLYQIQISGDKKLDKQYYNDTLKVICEKLFKITPKITTRKRGFYFNIYSKRLFELLTKRFGIPAGVKCYSIKIPDEIIKAGNNFLKFVLRGMFDTDGGIGLDKRKAYKKPYIRINYTSASPLLMNQLNEILIKYNLPHSTHKVNNNRAQQIQINGEKNVKLFLSNIGFSNPRHLDKVKHLM